MKTIGKITKRIKNDFQRFFYEIDHDILEQVLEEKNVFTARQAVELTKERNVPAHFSFGHAPKDAKSAFGQRGSYRPKSSTSFAIG